MNSKKYFVISLALLLTISTFALAQGRGGMWGGGMWGGNPTNPGTGTPGYPGSGTPGYPGSGTPGIPGSGQGNFLNGYQYFDANTVFTVTGTISELGGYFLQNGAGNYTGSGMMTTFTADNGDNYYVMLAPFWVLDQMDIDLEVGLALTLTGSAVAPHNPLYMQYDYMIVTSATINGVVYQLRDETGLPTWQVAGGNGGGFGRGAGGLYGGRGFGGYPGAGNNFGGGGAYNCPGFDSFNINTVSAYIEDIRYRANGFGADMGMELDIVIDGVTYTIFVAPLYYLEQINFTPGIGDYITVTGAVSANYFIVQTITDGNGTVYSFRDLNGKGLWFAN